MGLFFTIAISLLGSGASIAQVWQSINNVEGIKMIALLQDIKNIFVAFSGITSSYAATLAGAMDNLVARALSLDERQKRTGISTDTLQIFERAGARHGLTSTETDGDLVRFKGKFAPDKDHILENVLKNTSSKLDRGGLSAIRQFKKDNPELSSEFVDYLAHGPELDQGRIAFAANEGHVVMLSDEEIAAARAYSQWQDRDSTKNLKDARELLRKHKSVVGSNGVVDTNAGFSNLHKNISEQDEVKSYEKEGKAPNSTPSPTPALSTTGAGLNTSMEAYFTSWTLSINALKALVDEVFSTLEKATAGAAKGGKNGKVISSIGDFNNSSGSTFYGNAGVEGTSLGSIFDNSPESRGRVAAFVQNVNACLGVGSADYAYAGRPGMFTTVPGTDSMLGGASQNFNDNTTQYNTFNITSPDPMLVADRVEEILDRRRRVNYLGSYVQVC